MYIYISGITSHSLGAIFIGSAPCAGAAGGRNLAPSQRGPCIHTHTYTYIYTFRVNLSSFRSDININMKGSAPCAGAGGRRNQAPYRRDKVNDDPCN